MAAFLAAIPARHLIQRHARYACLDALVRILELRFEPVNESLIEPQTYLYYIQTQSSRGTDGVWIPFNEETEQTLLAGDDPGVPGAADDPHLDHFRRHDALHNHRQRCH